MNASHYQDIGQYLRDSRDSLRIPLAQAARDLHIREKYLKAIEAGELSILPGKTYTRGYIKTYAEYLRLDADKVLERYPDLSGEKPRPFFTPEPSHKHAITGDKPLFFCAISLIFVYVVWYFNFAGQPALPPTVAAVPEKFMHLLDKSPRIAMDRPWAECVYGTGGGCFTSLRAAQFIPAPFRGQGPTELEIELYDIPFTQRIVPPPPTPDEP
jgi:hypothetical protein